MKNINGEIVDLCSDIESEEGLVEPIDRTVLQCNPAYTESGIANPLPIFEEIGGNVQGLVVGGELTPHFDEQIRHLPASVPWHPSASESCYPIASGPIHPYASGSCHPSASGSFHPYASGPYGHPSASGSFHSYASGPSCHPSASGSFHHPSASGPSCHPSASGPFHPYASGTSRHPSASGPFHPYASGSWQPSASGPFHPYASGTSRHPSASGPFHPYASGSWQPSASGPFHPSASGSWQPPASGPFHSASGSWRPSASGPCGPSASRPESICRQFWKAGDYTASLNYAAHLPGRHNHMRIHPKFLHSNATSHKWVFGAIAELLDNAIDEVVSGATFVNVDKIINPKDGSCCLVVQDDGGGMGPESLRRCMGFGFSDKCTGSSIGQYGNGFKTSTMRIGADVIVFSRSLKERGFTESVGLLSYTYLRNLRLEEIIVPAVDYEFEATCGRLNRISGTDQKFCSNLSILLSWSPFGTELELQKQFDEIGAHGTRIIVFNLYG